MPTLLHHILSGLLLFLAALTIIGSTLSILPHGAWWVRAFDFPRYQLAAFSMICIIGLIVLWWPLQSQTYMWLRVGLLAALLSAGMYQGYRILPYTPLNAQMGGDATYPDDTSRQVSIMVINVFMDNTRYEDSVELIRKVSPDMVLALETDQEWVDALDALTDIYPHRVAVPLPNTYGMVLYSRLPLHDTHVNYLVQDDIPSIRTSVRLHNGEEFRFYGLHPRPPAPQESDSSTPRDAELVAVAREIAQYEQDEPGHKPIVVAGDMNDVAWSDTTQLFLKLSGLFDPRLGRGLFNTFPTHIAPLRVPLDHVFHSPNFKLVHMRRMPDVHSDHFPIYVRLGLEPGQGDGARALKLTSEDVDRASHTADEADIDMDTDAFHDKVDRHIEQEQARDVLELQDSKKGK